MLTLGNLIVFMLLFGAGAAFWRSRALNEHVLALVRRRCIQEDVLLLDDCVSLRRLTLAHDNRGCRRLAREFVFEFTVTGDRHHGRVLMFGRTPACFEFEPHPSRAPVQRDERFEQVVYLDEWRRRQQSSHV